MVQITDVYYQDVDSIWAILLFLGLNAGPGWKSGVRKPPAPSKTGGGVVPARSLRARLASGRSPPLALPCQQDGRDVCREPFWQLGVCKVVREHRPITRRCLCPSRRPRCRPLKTCRRCRRMYSSLAALGRCRTGRGTSQKRDLSTPCR